MGLAAYLPLDGQGNLATTALQLSHQKQNTFSQGQP